MTENSMRPVLGEDDDAARVVIMRRLFHRMSVVLDLMIDGFEANNDFTPKALILKLNELHSAHFAVLKLQEAFLEKQNPTAEIQSISADDLRASIGGQLDRIRTAIASEGVSKKPE